jgi:hypothetical protein
VAALAAVAAPAAGAQAEQEARVTIAILPHGTEAEDLEGLDGLAAGVMSAGIGQIPSAQTYLDITQGNRVSETLYDEELPYLIRTSGSVRPDRWQTVVERAEDVPADLVPGLLASTLLGGGVPMRADPEAGAATLLAADRNGRIILVDPARCPARGCPGVMVEESTVEGLPALIERLRGADMLIAFERPPPAIRVLTFAIAGSGFSGLVTSDSTRFPGLVTSTDIGPTILERFGIDSPDEMNGETIRAEGEPDIGELSELQARLRVTRERRGPVIGENLLVWVALAALAALAFGSHGARLALKLLALSVVYLPLVLLGTAALDPSLLAERLIAGAGAPLLAGLTLVAIEGWGALGLACGLTVGAYAIDVVAGSVLTPLSLPGPNPASGSRFFGIGNEIEAIVAALIPIGAGAAMAAIPATRDGGRAAATAFLVLGLIGAAVFAIGRFGADVGAAIVLPAGGAVAAAVALRSRRGLALALVVPFACLAVLAIVDLALGGGAHLTRSLLDAGGLGDAGELFERRIRLAASSFTRTANLPFMALAALFIALGIRYRDRVLGWFRERAARAGLAGAVAATLIGTVSNDSGVILLILGTGYVAATAGFAWAQAAADSERAGVTPRTLTPPQAPLT